jgi:hypothetical protein
MNYRTALAQKFMRKLSQEDDPEWGEDPDEYPNWAETGTKFLEEAMNEPPLPQEEFEKVFHHQLGNMGSPLWHGVFRELRALAEGDPRIWGEFGKYYPGWKPEDFQRLVGKLEERMPQRRARVADKFMRKLAQEDDIEEYDTTVWDDENPHWSEEEGEYDKPLSPLFMVRDTRNENEIGPFTEHDAHAMAKSLNDYVQRNRRHGDIGPKNPFKVVPSLETEGMLVAKKFMRKLAHRDDQWKADWLHESVEAPKKRMFQPRPDTVNNEWIVAPVVTRKEPNNPDEEIAFIDRNYPGIVYVGTWDSMRGLTYEGGAPVRVGSAHIEDTEHGAWEVRKAPAFWAENVRNGTYENEQKEDEDEDSYSATAAIAHKFMRKLAEHDPEGEHFDPMETPPQTTFDEPPEFDDDLDSKVSALVEQLQDGLMTKSEFKAALDRLLGESSMPPSMAWVTVQFIRKLAQDAAPAAQAPAAQAKAPAQPQTPNISNVTAPQMQAYINQAGLVFRGTTNVPVVDTSQVATGDYSVGYNVMYQTDNSYAYAVFSVSSPSTVSFYMYFYPQSPTSTYTIQSKQFTGKDQFSPTDVPRILGYIKQSLASFIQSIGG